MLESLIPTPISLTLLLLLPTLSELLPLKLLAPPSGPIPLILRVGLVSLDPGGVSNISPSALI